MLVRSANEGGHTMTDRELRDQLMTLLVAGHETTATALSWALERLTRHPAVLDKAVRAARDGDDEYLDAVAKETLRIRPVVFDVGRVLKQPVELAGYRLPAGVMVAPGIGLVHESDDVYPDAGRFDPGPDARRDARPNHLVPVRRRQPALLWGDVRDGRATGRAAGNPAPGGPFHHHSRRRTAARQARDAGPAPWGADLVRAPRGSRPRSSPSGPSRPAAS